MRVLLRVAYDGTNYHGWQFQENEDTIEGTILNALKELLKEDVELIGASRTDAGVHAYDNCAVFDTESTIPADRYSFALNNILPRDIQIVESSMVSDDFHPRFGAKNKTYEYRIYNNQVMMPDKRLYSYHYKGNLDVEKMDEAAKRMIGTHDFTSLASVHAQVKSFERTIYSCDVKSNGKDIIISVNGNGFLYNMVRIIAGTLLEVGIGKINPEDITEIILAKDRTKAGPTLPPWGLFLKEINYVDI